MTPELIGLASVVLLVALITLGVYTALALGTASVIALLVISGDPNIVIGLLGTSFYTVVKDYQFAIIPMYILMGVLISYGGVNEDIFAAANLLVGRVRAGLALTVVGGNAIFAAVTGSSIASACAFSKIAYEPMMKRGYSKSLTLGTIAGSSVLGMLIPPSVNFIMYSILTGVSVGQMYMAGIIPGFVLTAIFSLGLLLIIKLRPQEIGASRAQAQGSEVVIERSSGAVLLSFFPVVVLIGGVLGGIYTGIFTALEAGAVGCLGALVISAMKRNLSVSKYISALKDTSYTVGALVFVLICAQIYSRMLAISGVNMMIQNFFAELSIPPVAILTLFIALIIALGCLVDSISILFITVPILLPIAKFYGLDLIWMGIVVCVAVEVGLITPPFGLSVFAVKATIGDEVTVEEIFRGSLWFVVMMILFICILVAFPSLSTMLVKTGLR